MFFILNWLQLIIILNTEFTVFLDLFIDIYFAFISHFRETNSFFFFNFVWSGNKII